MCRLGRDAKLGSNSTNRIYNIPSCERSEAHYISFVFYDRGVGGAFLLYGVRSSLECGGLCVVKSPNGGALRSVFSGITEEVLKYSQVGVIGLEINI